MDDSESSPSPQEDVPVRSRRAHRSSKDRDRLYMGGSSREFARLLVYQEREAMELRKKLEFLTEQLRTETQRADVAESKAREAALRFKSANDARIIALQEAQRANETLNLYRLSLDNAQKEINKAQDIIDAVEAQRVDAEESAARARTTARQLKEERIVSIAREEGRRQGLQEGLERGRHIGFEEGRAEGYARGRTAAGRMRRQYAEDVSESPDEGRSVVDDPQSEPSASPPDDYEPRPQSVYSQTLDQNSVRSRRTAASAGPAPAPPPVPEPPKDPEIHPTIIHNMAMSPSHPPVEFPPDGWIPKVDNDSRIRLPPPHELGSPPPILLAQSSAVLHNASVQDLAEDRPPLRIPPPSADHGEAHISDSDSTTGTTPTHRRPRHRRRRSSESLSTTMSQFEILRERPSVLSDIAEERERTSSMSSPAPGAGNSPYMPSPASTFYRANPQTPAADVHRFEDGNRNPPQNIYMRPPHSPNSSPESGRVVARSPTLRPPSQQRGSRGSSLSPEYAFNVEPPSGPESPQSRTAPMTPHLLSAEDVPLPPADNIGTSGAPQMPGQGVPNMPPPGSVPVVLSEGQLPPGFQPIGLPVAAGSFVPVGGPQPSITPQTMYTTSIGSIGPAGVPLPPSSYGGTPSIAGSNFVPGGFPTGEPVVIPNLMPSSAPGAAGVQPGRRYSRSAFRGSSSDSDVSSGLDGSLDSLTTPPARRRELSHQSTPTYAVAPVPDNIVYPAPPTPRSTSSRTTAARVPLPPSTAASVTSPGSTVGYPYGQTQYSRSNLALDAGRTPLPMNMPMSPMMGSARGTPAQLPPQMESRTSIYDLRGRNEDDFTRANTMANAGPVRPPSAARMSSVSSPTISQVSLAPTSSTSKTKKSKKSKKAKSKFTSVEEVPDEE